MAIYKKYDSGIYRIREICGIKITTKPLKNKIDSLFSYIYEIEKKIDSLDIRNKARMQILALGDKKIIEEKRKEKLIVSLTTFPQRIYDIDVVLFSLLNQTIKPDKIILWLSVEEFPNLEDSVPLHILNMRKFGIEIEFCNNLYSYNKLIHSLKKYPNDIIVTADDDIYYEYDWLEKLYNAYLENPNYIHCHRAHKIKFDKKGNILPYNEWESQIYSDNTELSYINFFTGVGGILYKYNLLYKDVLNEKLFMKLSPKNDDIWFWTMAVLNNTKINVVKHNINSLTEIGYSNYRRLYNLNVLEEINDIQLNNIFKHYGSELKDKLN
ncbi:hypothetical protein R4L75_09220 [Brachyspira pilosicoli]|uniref:hypothetical protein n=1 Tax=Brachyspira pilosicoli TaxID=52584 RepID=UPI003003AC26